MTSFGVYQRDTHHWDITNIDGRLFCIRGEPGNIYIRDERKDGRPYPRDDVSFRTVTAAMS